MMSQSLSRLNKDLAGAVDLFVMTKFDQCFNVCNNVIKTAKCEPEQERNYEVIEAATALGIQALAETDMWHEVVAFITDVYGTVDLCPPRIVQVCILLHAHVKEYLPCHNLVQTWLRNPHNLNHKQCSQVIRVYAHHILCPTGSYDTLREVVQSCSSLTETERATLMQFPQTERYKDAKRDNFELKESESEPNTSETANGSKPWLESFLGNFQDPIGSHLSQGNAGGGDAANIAESASDPVENLCKGKSTDYSICLQMYHGCTAVWRYLRSKGFTLIFMGIFAVWALVQTQTGDPVSTLGRLVVLWRVFLQKLGLFTVHK